MKVLRVFVDGELMPVDSYKIKDGAIRFTKPLAVMFPKKEKDPDGKEHEFQITIEGECESDDL